MDDSAYLVLNEGQSYGIHIQADEPVESFCIFFAPGFAEEVRRSVAERADVLLDEPEGNGLAPVHFFEKTYAHDRILSPALLRLRNQYSAHLSESDWFLERLHGIIERLLRAHEFTVGEARRLQSVRAATREELYRRVCRARDFAAAMFTARVTLNELSAVSCLSPNHLLRTFRQVFGQTPHQYLTHCRLQRAKRLLAKSEMPVTEICLEVGFESLGSFSSRFRREFGVSPSDFRTQAHR